MAKDTHERIITSVPVDGMARRVSGPGEQFRPDITIQPLHWDTPPPMLPPRAIPAHSRDLPGREFGRFTVIGQFLEPRDAPKRKGKPLWVCRCRCGAYEGRVAKAIRNPNNSEDRCHTCRSTQQSIKRGGSIRPKWVSPRG